MDDKIVVYDTSDGETSIEVRLEGGDGVAFRQSDSFAI